MHDTINRNSIILRKQDARFSIVLIFYRLFIISIYDFFSNSHLSDTFDNVTCRIYENLFVHANIILAFLKKS